MTGTRRDSGRKGGLVTLERYGRDQLAEWGRRGGRPRSLSYDDIQQHQALEQHHNNNREVISADPPGKHNQLRRHHKLRAAESSGDPNITGRDCPENPTRPVPAGKDV